MSALGQKRTCAAHKLMSALTPKADMCSALADVLYGPKADIGPMPDIAAIYPSARASTAGGIVGPVSSRF